jgi:hypothetical protein
LAVFCALVLQELGLGFATLSCSEPNTSFQRFVLANHSPMHFHSTMNHQTAGCACVLHPLAESCAADPGVVNVAVFGTPCPPFSTQRAKRRVDGSVQAHAAYLTTFEDSISWLSKFEPITACMEQVLGFDMAVSTSDSSTPMNRPWCLTSYLFAPRDFLLSFNA